MTLRSNLLLLVAGTVLPLLALALILGYVLIEHENDTTQRGAVARTRAFMTAVDAELVGHILSLRGLATSRSLERGDVRAFGEEMARFLASQPDWQLIFLSTPRGEQILNTAPGFVPGRQDTDLESLERAVAMRAPFVGDIVLGRLSRAYGVPLRIPVMRNGEVAYVLTAAVKPTAFARLMAKQNLPPSWVSGLVDRKGYFLARVPVRTPADRASEAFRSAVAAGGSEGWYRGRTVEGIDTFTAYRVSEFSGWSVGLAIPSAEVYAVAYRATWYMLVGALASLLLAGGFAWWMGRRIARPIGALAGAARELGAGGASPRSVGDATIGEVRELSLALQDASRAVHEREEAHRRLATVVQQMPGGVIIADAAGNRIIANEQAGRILGHSILKTYHDDELSAVTGACFPDGRPYEPKDYPLARALRGDVLTDEEILVQRSGGRRQTISASAAAIRAADGSIMGAVVTFMDVTARKQAEEDRVRALAREQEARTEAELANRSKDEFLAMLGHELRNPLAPIRTALQLMRLRGDDALMKERLVIERQVEHLVRLVDDLLDVSRITSGKVELKRERVELSAVVAEAIEMASPIIEQRQHRLDVNVPHAGMAIEGDAARLAQAVCNLLTNAAKYTESKGQIAIDAQRSGAEAVLRVRDNGVGIAPDLLARIFEPFVQAPQALERAQGGLGLGLAIVRSLVALHGGSVQAESEGAGRGAQFTLRLPLTEPAAAVERAEVAASRARAPAADAKRVLIVDDNPDAAETLAAALRLHGMAVEVAHDGPQALKAAPRFRPDVGLLDIGLPVMDGYELARRLRSAAARDPQSRALKLIALSGYSEQSDRERSREAGFLEHLVKPVDLDALLALIAGGANLDGRRDVSHPAPDT
jgi:PAS domain S-box-containing protein